MFWRRQKQVSPPPAVWSKPFSVEESAVINSHGLAGRLHCFFDGINFRRNDPNIAPMSDQQVLWAWQFYYDQRQRLNLPDYAPHRQDCDDTLWAGWLWHSSIWWHLHCKTPLVTRGAGSFHYVQGKTGIGHYGIYNWVGGDEIHTWNWFKSSKNNAQVLRQITLSQREINSASDAWH
jgi:hypothetical protein